MHSNPLTPHHELFLQIFLTDCQARNLRPRTLQFYRQQMTWFLTYGVGAGCKTVEEVTPYLVRAYFVHLQTERQWAAASVHGAARAMRAFFNFMAAEHLIELSPMKRVKMPRNDQPERLPFTAD